MGLGIRFAVTIVFFGFIGYWLDQQFEFKALFIIICTLVGLVAALYSVFYTIYPTQNRDSKSINDE